MLRRFTGTSQRMSLKAATDGAARVPNISKTAFTTFTVQSQRGVVLQTRFDAIPLSFGKSVTANGHFEISTYLANGYFPNTL